MRIFLFIAMIVYSTYAIAEDQEAALPEMISLLKAAESGDAASQNKLGQLYLTGEDLSGRVVKFPNFTKAAEWFRKAAKKDFVQAQSDLATIYRCGDSCPIEEDAPIQSDTEVFKWLKKAAEQGLPEAQNRLGYIYNSGRGVSKDSAEAVKWHHKAAEQGYAEAQHRLGYIYAKGIGVERNQSVADSWCKKAAQQGFYEDFRDPHVSYEYLWSEGELSFNWARLKEPAHCTFKFLDVTKSKAKDGDTGAQYRLGVRYAEGKGIPKDYGQALKWFRKAADKGHSDSQFVVGFYYASGLGGNQNYVDAVKFLKMSAEQDNANAQAALGALYRDGLGVKKNLSESDKWYKKAKEKLGLTTESSDWRVVKGDEVSPNEVRKILGKVDKTSVIRFHADYEGPVLENYTGHKLTSDLDVDVLRVWSSKKIGEYGFIIYEKQGAGHDCHACGANVYVVKYLHRKNEIDVSVNDIVGERGAWGVVGVIRLIEFSDDAYGFKIEGGTTHRGVREEFLDIYKFNGSNFKSVGGGRFEDYSGAIVELSSIWEQKED